MRALVEQLCHQLRAQDERWAHQRRADANTHQLLLARQAELMRISNERYETLSRSHEQAQVLIQELRFRNRELLEQQTRILDSSRVISDSSEDDQSPQDRLEDWTGQDQDQEDQEERIHLNSSSPELSESFQDELDESRVSVQVSVRGLPCRAGDVGLNSPLFC